MAFQHARSGVCTSGAAISALVNKSIDVRIGPSQSNPLRQVPFRLAQQLDGGASTCTFLIDGPKPTKFQDVILRRGTADTDVYWAGTILGVRANIEDEVPRWDVTAVDWTWLLDRYTTVTAVFRNRSVNSILRELVEGFADPGSGFLTGYCPDTLGSLTEIRFDGVLLSAAITSLAKAASAYARIRPSKRIDLAVTFPEGNALTLSDSGSIRDFSYDEDASLVATRVRFVGRSTPTTATVAPGATTIAVEDVGPFNPSGGQVVVGQNDVTYTGLSVTSGPGSLTGVSGVTQPIEQGASVSVLAIANDGAAQTALAAALGGGRSGIAEAAFRDDSLTDADAHGRAAAYLSFYKSADGIPAVEFTIDDANYRVGKLMTLNLSAPPIAVAGEFRIQTLDVTYDEDLQADDLLPRLEHHVTGRVGRRLGIYDVMVTR